MLKILFIHEINSFENTIVKFKTFYEEEEKEIFSKLDNNLANAALVFTAEELIEGVANFENASTNVRNCLLMLKMHTPFFYTLLEKIGYISELDYYFKESVQ